MLSHALPVAAAADDDEFSESLLLVQAISMDCLKFHGPRAQAQRTLITRNCAQIALYMYNSQLSYT